LKCSLCQEVVEGSSFSSCSKRSRFWLGLELEWVSLVRWK